VYSAGFAVDDLATSDSGAVVRDGNLWVLTEQISVTDSLHGIAHGILITVPTGFSSRFSQTALYGVELSGEQTRIQH
tara:strand:- start:224 stop:454 length:231 start_codon:yes stop_codon:yes gene_type:complete